MWQQDILCSPFVVSTLSNKKVKHENEIEVVKLSMKQVESCSAGYVLALIQQFYINTVFDNQ